MIKTIGTAQIFGQILREDVLENLVTTGKEREQEGGR